MPPSAQLPWGCKPWGGSPTKAWDTPKARAQALCTLPEPAQGSSGLAPTVLSGGEPRGQRHLPCDTREGHRAGPTPTKPRGSGLGGSVLSAAAFYALLRFALQTTAHQTQRVRSGFTAAARRVCFLGTELMGRYGGTLSQTHCRRPGSEGGKGRLRQAGPGPDRAGHLLQGRPPACVSPSLRASVAVPAGAAGLRSCPRKCPRKYPWKCPRKCPWLCSQCRPAPAPAPSSPRKHAPRLCLAPSPQLPNRTPCLCPGCPYPHLEPQHLPEGREWGAWGTAGGGIHQGARMDPGNSGAS